jgi:hypothetical protein
MRSAACLLTERAVCTLQFIELCYIASIAMETRNANSTTYLTDGDRNKYLSLLRLPEKGCAGGIQVVAPDLALV